MNWKKIAVNIFSAGALTGLGSYANNPGASFNFKTVGIPAVATILASMLSLFQQPPHTDATAQEQDAKSAAAGK